MNQSYQNFFRSAKKAAGRAQRSDGANAKKTTGRKQAAPSSDFLREEVLRRLHEDRRGNESSKTTPETLLRDHLQKKIKSRTVKQKAKAPFPVLATTTLLLIAGCVVGGFIFPDVLDGVVSKLQIGFFTSATAAEPEGASKADASSKKEKEKSAAATAETEAKKSSTESKSESKSGADSATSAGYRSNEEMSFFNKLSERKKQLDARESELSKLEEELHKQRAELDGKIQQLETMRKQIADQLQGRVVQDQEKVNKLVEFYSSMKPQQAAKVIESINEDLAVEILDKMKKKSAAEILNTMEAKKAQKLSESLAGYRRPAGSVQ